MRWRNIAFMAVLLVLMLFGPAESQQWVDIKNPKELRALHSNKTFRYTSNQVPVVQHHRADGKGIEIYGERRIPYTWEVKGNDQVCISFQTVTWCYRFQRSKKNPDEYVRRNIDPSTPQMQIFKVEDGIPDF